MKVFCLAPRMAIALAVGAVLVASAGNAMAQRGGGGPGGRGTGGTGGRGTSGLQLLQSEQVQKELELVDDQKEALKKISESMRTDMREMFTGMQGLSSEERTKKFEEMRGKMETKQKEYQAKVDEVLLPNQRDRLKQITMQVSGNSALTSDDAVKALGLTDDQKEKIKKIGEDARTEMRTLFQGGGQGTDRTAQQEKMDKMRKDTEEKIMAVLTSEQKAKLEELKGKKFEIDRNALFGGQRGQRGNRGTPPATPPAKPESAAK